MYASTLSSQLYGAVATGHAELAEAVIDAARSDRNVYGVAVYGPGGRLLAGHGHFPAALVSGEDAKFTDDRVLVTVREMPVGEGAVGHLCSRFPPNTSPRRVSAPRSFRR